jgi:hypothetical protein
MAEKWLIRRFGGKSAIVRIANFLMTRLSPVNAEKGMGEWRISAESARVFNSEARRKRIHS